MQLYSMNSLVEKGVSSFLDRDDKNLDRGLKRLQIQKMAGEQGLDWRRYMSDDAAEESHTAQGAIAYGARAASRSKPVVSLTAQTVTAKPAEFAEFMKNAKSGASTAFYGPSRFLSGLMADAKAGNMTSKISKALRFASFL